MLRGAMVDGWVTRLVDGNGPMHAFRGVAPISVAPGVGAPSTGAQVPHQRAWQPAIRLFEMSANWGGWN